MDVVLLLKAAILGIVEGVTEFIPVSSTGHLILAQDWLGFTGRKENAFIIFIQLGAILAVVWLYRRKFIDVLLNLHRDARARRLVVNLVVGTLPAVVIGLPTEKWIEARLFKPLPVALAFAIGGLAILWVERSRIRRRGGVRRRHPVEEGARGGVLPGAGGALPGHVALGRDHHRRAGARALAHGRDRVLFFMAIPAMLGATIIKLWKVREIIAVADIPVFGTGFVVAFVSAAIVIRGLIAYVSHRSFTPFAWYRIGFGVLILAVYWNRPF